jgi:hypothetical protein
MVGCPQKNDLAQNEREIRKYQLASKMASEGLESALKQVEENKSAGLVKLYEIATNDDEYSVEISEVANEKLHYYLYLKTEFWIRTFAKVDLNQFKQYLKRSDVEVFSLPEGLTPAEKFRAQMLQNLKKFKGTDKEMDLVNYVLELYQQ